MEVTKAYYEAQLVIAQADSMYYQGELQELRKMSARQREQIDHLIDELGDLEHRMRQVQHEADKLREIVQLHIVVNEA